LGSIIRNSNIDWNSFIGKDLGTVTLIRELGRGVMGVVFVAYQKTLKRQVAVKVLAKKKIANDLATDLFRDEGEIVAVLSHPNIIPIFEMGEVDDCYFQVMQFVDGIDLRTMLRRQLNHPLPSKRLLPQSEAIGMCIQIADALGYAHEEGIVHQDVKPANILIENRLKRPMVADFGIARAFAGDYKSDGLIVGSPLYMSPEQAMGKVTDGRADIYSLGVILFELIVGQLPIRFEERSEKILERKKQDPETFFIAKPSAVLPSIGKNLERIIMKSTAALAAQRYFCCEEMIDDLKSI